MLNAVRVTTKLMCVGFLFVGASLDVGGCGRPLEPRTITIDLGPGTPIDCVLIPPGSFIIAAPESPDERRACGGRPMKEVIPDAFYMSVFPITQAQYEAVMGWNPSVCKGARNPVDSVTWVDAIMFCQKASLCTGRHFELPTDVEWEYACRAGRPGPGFIWEDEQRAPPASDFEFKTHPVGLKKPNGYGLYDMNGDVFEWCADIYTLWYGCRESRFQYAERDDRHSYFCIARGTNLRFSPEEKVLAASRCSGPVDVRGPACGFRILVRPCE